MRIYLAGPIFGRSDDDCRAWRKRAASFFTPLHEICDPMDRDFRGLEVGNESEIVKSDLAAIAECDALLVNANEPSWGTAMEIVYAKQRGLFVSSWCGRAPVSPWLRHHSDAVSATLLGAAYEIARKCRMTA